MNTIFSATRAGAQVGLAWEIHDMILEVIYIKRGPALNPSPNSRVPSETAAKA